MTLASFVVVIFGSKSILTDNFQRFYEYFTLLKNFTKFHLMIKSFLSYIYTIIFLKLKKFYIKTVSRDMHMLVFNVHVKYWPQYQCIPGVCGWTLSSWHGLVILGLARNLSELSSWTCFLYPGELQWLLYCSQYCSPVPPLWYMPPCFETTNTDVIFLSFNFLINFYLLMSTVSKVILNNIYFLNLLVW